MPLKFQDRRWRFRSPGALPDRAVDAFLAMIDAIGEQKERKGVYELFKDCFRGSPTPSSTSTTYARYDLEQLMKEVAPNAPRFIAAFLQGCDTRAAHDEDVPDIDIVNEVLAEHEAGYQVVGDTLVATTESVNEVPVEVTPMFFNTLTGRMENADSDEIQTDDEDKGDLQVFLCHSSGDKEAARALHRRLQADGYSPWLDEVDLIAGQDWDLEIRKAVRSSHVILVLLSDASVKKAGYVQKEIRVALDAADEQPEGAIFIIPARLEDADVPERLARIQYVDLFKRDGYAKLLKALEARRATLD